MPDPLISVDELAANPERFRVYDLRWSLTDPDIGSASYLAGHIPGAVFVDLDSDLAAPPSLDGRHPLPDPAEFAATLGRLGLTPEDHAVVYDDIGGAVAARMWWMLRAIGHRAASVLDGGYQAWVEAGRPVATGAVTPEPTTYPEPPGFDGVVTRDHLEGRVLIDARLPERFRGEIEPVDPKAGHIPGALSVPVSELPGRLKEIPKSREVIAYCRGPYCVYSVDALAILRKHGYRARRAEDGLPGWRTEGLEVVAGA